MYLFWKMSFWSIDMDTRELIQKLRTMPGNMDFSPQIRAKAADKLEELQQLIDDMLGDHYVDYLEFYINRCRELEEKLEKCRRD